MAVALKCANFTSPHALALFCADVANNVTNIVTIQYDDAIGWVLFYT